MVSRVEVTPARFRRESDGAVVPGRIVQEWIDASGFDGKAEIKGLVKTELSDGSALNATDAPNVFRHFSTRVIYTRIE